MATAAPDSAQNAVADSEEMSLVEIEQRVIAAHERVAAQLADKRAARDQLNVEIAELVVEEKAAARTRKAFRKRGEG